MGEFVLELRNIGKTFSGVNVLRGVDMSLKKGEIHVLLGENGAGKSTLIKILAGYHQPDSGGEIIVNGEQVSFKNPREAFNSSIHTIYQELTLCNDMTVAENIVLDKQDLFPGINQKKDAYRKMATDVLDKLGQNDIKPEMMIRQLSIAQRQMVEIAKAITAEARIILMDEPTSSISQQDADQLLQIIRNLRDEGVTIIYISHRLHEIEEIADKITVLRDGSLVGTVDAKDVSSSQLINMMVGRDIENIYPKEDVELGDVALKLENVCSDAGFKDVSFEVRKGEIFGIGGLVGAKRTEILETIFGLRKVVSGNMHLNGKEYKPRNPRDAILNKIAFVTEDRKKSGLVLCLPVFENLSLLNVQMRKSRLGYVNWKEMKNKGEVIKDRLSIRLNSMEQLISTLSGGNQQKVALGKWLDFEPDILLFDEPTRGVDIGAKTEIYSIIGKLAKSGVVIIMVSSELPELISVSDNILVMREGVMKGIINREEATQENIMELATSK